MSDTHAPPPQAVAASEPDKKLELKPSACSTCVQRKVKCDKTVPCGSCTRSRLQCFYKPLTHTAKRKRESDAGNDALLAIVRAHESLLRKNGLSFESIDAVKPDLPHSPATGDLINSVPPRPPSPKNAGPAFLQKGILIRENGGKRYYDYGLIGTLGQKFTQDGNTYYSQYGLGVENTPSATHESPREPSIVTSLANGVSSYHPHDHIARVRRPGLFARLWPFYLENVHPVIMAFHPHTVHRLISSNEEHQGTPADALRLAICCCALSSMSDKECQAMLGEDQTTLLTAFQSVTKSTLLDSSFFRGRDLDLLTAQVLLLTSMVHTSDSSSLWIMMGSTMRMAQLLGLHRDGAGLGLDPFEVECRRRLWWLLVSHDIRMTELMGLESSLPRKRDCPLPSNINDADISVDMKTVPRDRVGATEMTFCLLKYEINRYLLEIDQRYGNMPTATSDTPKRSLDDLERLLEERFLKFCNPVVPVQFLTTIMARSYLCKLKQLAQHRRSRHHPDEAEEMTSAQTSLTLSLATRSVEYDNLVHCNRSLAGYRWHVRFYFPWGAPIFILKILARPDWDAEMHAAWRQIEELHEHHPEYQECDTVVHLIVNDMTLKAWKGHELYMRSKGADPQMPPAFVSALIGRTGQMTPAQQQLITSYQQSYGMHHPLIPGQEGLQLDPNQFTPDMNAFAPMSNGLDFLDPALVGADWSEWSGY